MPTKGVRLAGKSVRGAAQMARRMREARPFSGSARAGIDAKTITGFVRDSFVSDGAAVAPFGRASYLSSIAPPKVTKRITLTKAFVVKKAALSLERSSARTSEC